MIIPAYKYINAYTRLCIIISSVLFLGIWCLISGLLLIFNNGWNSCGKSYKDEAGATKQTTHPNKHHGKSIVNKVPIRDLTLRISHWEGTTDLSLLPGDPTHPSYLPKFENNLNMRKESAMGHGLDEGCSFPIYINWGSTLAPSIYVVGSHRMRGVLA